MKNIGWHTRLYKDPKVKCCGGSFGGDIGLETVERLVKFHFEVSMLPSGRPVFVDKEGREVLLYFTIDPASTSKGKEVFREYLNQKRIEEEKREKIEQEQKEELEELMRGLSHQEIVNRLKG